MRECADVGYVCVSVLDLDTVCVSVQELGKVRECAGGTRQGVLEFTGPRQGV